MNSKVQILENDVDGIQTAGQAAERVVQGAGQALAARQQQVPAVTPMDMLDRALANGAGLDMVEKLMTLQERWETTQARKAFNEAFAAFKSEAVTIVRNKKITDGPLKGKSYAELFSFVEAVTPALSKYGLSASWAITRDEKDWIEVTCTIEHVLGHAKKVSLGGPPDAGGAKNPIQARMSTVTYLERHSLKAACGLAEQGDDTDGRADKVDAGPITAEQVENLRALLKAAGADEAKFCQWGKVNSLEEIRASDYVDAVNTANAKKRAAA